MAGLRFKIAELEREIRAMETMGKEFLNSQTLWTLEHLRRDLNSIGGAQKGNDYNLKLQCLHTIPSDQYEAGSRRGSRKIHAVISGTWDLRPLAKREIEFCGIASTKIKLYDSDNPKTRLAMWRLELGDAKSPGCYVHAQILGDSDKPPFPEFVPIPRLSSLFVTPMSAVEFVLGELFQDKWPEVTASGDPEVKNWRALQKKWLQSLFSWYRREMEKTDFSSWIALKKAKPKSDMFLPKSRKRRS